jgi:membrane-bound serine protease (ClpP class)
MWLGKKLFESSALGGLALNEVQDTKAGYTVAEEDMTSLQGQTGVAETILRPAGKVNINGKIYDAVALIAYIDKGEAIRVVGYENQSLVVNKA